MRPLLACVLALGGCLSAPATPDAASASDGGYAPASDLGLLPPLDLAPVPLGDGGLAMPDLAVASDLALASTDMGRLAPDDAAAGDLGPPTIFCDGTPVAGTCAAAFFAPVASCFVATGGCSENKSMAGGITCWQSGARLVATFDGAMMTTSGVWSGPSGECMAGTVGTDANGNTVFTLQQGGATLVYNAGTGDVTCPDGSTVNIGPVEGYCPALQSVLDPSTNDCNVLLDGGCAP